MQEPGETALPPLDHREIQRRASERDQEVYRLGERIALIAAEIEAATYQLLVLLREFDRHPLSQAGFRSTAHWLAWRTGIGLGAARERVRVARALGELPQISEAMRQGEVSFSKVRAMTRVATAENEDELLYFARNGTAAHVEKLVRAWRGLNREAELDLEERRQMARSVEIWRDDDGMVIVKARLMPETGAALEKALDAGCERLFQEASNERGPADDEVPMCQRRADAFALLAESALASGLDPGTLGDRYQVVVHVDAELLAEAGPEASDRAGGEGRPTTDRAAAGPGDLAAESSSAPEIGRPVASRQKTSPEAGEAAAEASAPAPCRDVSAETSRAPESSPCEDEITDPDVSAETFEASRIPPIPPSRAVPSPYLENGTAVAAETARRLACEASRVVMQHAEDGRILDLGRRTRVVSPALRRALAHRDRSCRFPGCEVTHCDAHHVRHWADGGATRLDNLVLLCRRHHRAVHEEGFSLALARDGELSVRTPRGRRLLEAPCPPPLAARPRLRHRLSAAGVTLDPDRVLPTWNGDRCDWSMALAGPGSP